jgi:hypothetical protein
MALRRRSYKVRPLSKKIRNIRRDHRPPAMGGVSKKRPIPRELLMKVFGIFSKSPGRRFKIASAHKYYRVVLSLAAKGKIARQGNEFWLEKKEVRNEPID